MITSENFETIKNSEVLRSVPIEILIPVLVELDLIGALKSETWKGIDDVSNAEL